jgi:two-component system, cell cycle sensor histidine kinase and response regulator CckA
MAEEVRVLIIEDDPADADLMVLALERAGLAPKWERVETESDYLSALGQPPDIILSDSSLPGFDGLRALDLLRQSGIDIPFILVSGRVGEDLAVDAMKRGASDYLLKDRLARLGEAVRRAMEQGRLRREKAWAIEALRRSEDRYRRLVEADVVGIALTDGERFLEANNYLLRMLGYSREEFESGAVRWLDITPPEHRELSDRAFRQLVETGTCPAFEKEYFAKDGRRIPVLLGSVALGDPPHRQFLSYVIDLTERRQLEEQFRQAQKLESFGQLAGGIAHDFNNLLTVITGYSAMMMDSIPPEHHLRSAIEQISEAARRSSDLTRQLLTFSRRQPSQPKPIVLNHVVRDIEKMLRRLIGEDIELNLGLSPHEAVIRADPGQIEQVIVNLVVNARDAMPNGGTLLIETLVIQGSCVLLHVHDTGEGMTPEIQARIFEPFFTTKEPGKGTGLGLSTVYGIVRQSGGAISVVSEPGGGSMFRVQFPCTEAPAEYAETRRPEMPRGGNETILVAEDEEGVRSYVRHVLEQSGYAVLEAPNGRMALELAARYPEPIHLFLSDIVMPEGGGADLTKQFLAIRPGVPVLRMSGYADRIEQAAAIAAGAYIQKPFTAPALLNQVRRLLDQTGPALENVESARAPEAVKD